MNPAIPAWKWTQPHPLGYLPSHVTKSGACPWGRAPAALCQEVRRPLPEWQDAILTPIDNCVSMCLFGLPIKGLHWDPSERGGVKRLLEQGQFDSASWCESPKPSLSPGWLLIRRSSKRAMSLKKPADAEIRNSGNQYGVSSLARRK